MANNEDDHVHGEECIELARARLRVLRSMIEMNNNIIAAYERHTAHVVEVVMEIERSTTRLNMNDVLRAVPTMGPPAMRRQHAGFIPASQTFDFSDEAINALENNLPQWLNW